MKARTNIWVSLMLLLIVITGCKKQDEGEEMTINFKTTSGYTYTDATLNGGSSVKIGIEAETIKKKDPIIKFNISKSVNGGGTNTVYSEDLETTAYNYDYIFTLDTVSGHAIRYTFTVTNRDGLLAQKFITLTVK